MNNILSKSLPIKIFLLSGVLFFLFMPHLLFAKEVVISMPTRGFWHVHNLVNGLFFCLMLAVFPRFTLAFISLITGTIGITLLGIIGWVIAPHIVVAFIATTLYWNTDPILVILAWFIAFGGEATEKTVIVRRF